MELSILGRGSCSGGRCLTNLPQLLEPDEDGVGRPRFATVAEGQHELARSAVTQCPQRSIVLIGSEPDRSASEEDQR